MATATPLSEARHTAGVVVLREDIPAPRANENRDPLMILVVIITFILIAWVERHSNHLPRDHDQN